MNISSCQISALALVTILAGCGHEATPATTAPSQVRLSPPNAIQAKAIIEESPEFDDFHFTDAAYSLPMATSAMNADAHMASDDLMHAGWITTSPTGIVPAAKAKSDPRFLIRPNGVLDVVPLAKKRFLDVTRVTPNRDGTVSAHFTWRWEANMIGAAFRSASPIGKRYSAASYAADATLQQDGTAWSVLRIRD